MTARDAVPAEGVDEVDLDRDHLPGVSIARPHQKQPRFVGALTMTTHLLSGGLGH
jgi:hypothetical protein